jgi:hypothetical protein
MKESRRPAFADEFPRTADLDEVVGAFARGDYARVRARAILLEKTSPDPSVRNAARLLVERTRPDPLAVTLLVIAGLLLVTMAVWWVLHGRPPS